jgi:hypothetical protein
MARILEAVIVFSKWGLLPEKAKLSQDSGAKPRILQLKTEGQPGYRRKDDRLTIAGNKGSSDFIKGGS